MVHIDDTFLGTSLGTFLGQDTLFGTLFCDLPIGVERDFVFYQEFLIPGASVGILECTHFSEWFGYNHTR